MSLVWTTPLATHSLSCLLPPDLLYVTIISLESPLAPAGVVAATNSVGARRPMVADPLGYLPSVLAPGGTQHRAHLADSCLGE